MIIDSKALVTLGYLAIIGTLTAGGGGGGGRSTLPVYLYGDVRPDLLKLIRYYTRDV